MNRKFSRDRSASIVSPTGGLIVRSLSNRRQVRPRAGVALVITLIMLSIITVIAITILAIARRDRANATQAFNLTDSRLAAEAGLERAKGEIVAQIINLRTLMGYDVTVSRSLSNLLDQLLIDPRVPVFLPANQMFPDELVEGRFFLDLNRDGRFQPTFPGLSGDPQWIGLLNKPDQKHGPNNRFHGRFCFFVVPSGKTLDVNFVHNMASASPSGLKFFRNEGFGPWEINLGAFFADLPTSASPWDYRYESYPLPISTGAAFDDAFSLLTWRYATNSPTFLPTIAQLYGVPGASAFTADLIDGYAHAPAAMGGQFPTADPESMVMANTFPWTGADSVQHFFTPGEFFNPSRTSVAFTNRLRTATAADPYLFYRMLAQLGTDSAPSSEDKLHLNYVNQSVDLATLARINAVAPWNARPILTTNLSATNFVPWSLADASGAQFLSVQFFTNVAQRLFEQQFRQFNPQAGLGITNIPSMVCIPVATPDLVSTRFYSPALHRLLQQAANIYDATRDDPFPSVFRPIISQVTLPNVLTNGVTSTLFCITGFTNDSHRTTLDGWLTANKQFSIPLVIGAKKGFPNFNEFTLRTDFQVTRKLEFVRVDTNSLPSQTNQMYLIGISNLFAAEAWNSYLVPYPRALSLEVTDEAVVSITNIAGLKLTLPLTFVGSYTNLAANFWQGREFKLPLFQQKIVLPTCRYLFQSQSFETVGTNLYFTETENMIGFPVPDWQFSISNKFEYVLTDVSNDKVVDFVLSSEFNTAVNLDAALMNFHPVPNSTENPTVTALWDTNRLDGNLVANPTLGVLKQIEVSKDPDTSATLWKDYVNDTVRGMDKEKAVMSFRAFVGEGVYGQFATNLAFSTALKMQAPFCPTRKLVQTTTWQADDPLVHYHVGDLMIFPTNSIFEPVVPPGGPIPTNMSLATVNAMNRRYAPWGGNPLLNDPINPTDPYAYDGSVKDPGVRYSDDWDFPAGKYPGVGWLGRVHRGTPWQTVFFKPVVAPADAWQKQSADYLYSPLWYRAHPTNDWRLADLFTTATDPNASRGLLSINQTNFAAWSAVLSGAVLLQNGLSDQKVLSVSQMTNSAIQLDPLLIQPALVDTNVPPSLVKLVNAINTYREGLPTRNFTSLADFLQVPELTVASPWLNTATKPQLWYGLNDSAYERLPQQILSLLKSGDSRFVVYAYGQALKPADGSILTSDTMINGKNIPARTCVNYQVTAEVGVRAVIRVEGTWDHPLTVIESFNILPPE